LSASVKKVLLHICCGPCSTWSIESLKENCEPVLYWSNSNIWPPEESDLRLENARKVAAFHRLQLIEDTYDHTAWLKAVTGFEKEPEGGKRCAQCFAFGFKRSAQVAAELGISLFTTTLTISPYKSNDVIHEIGKQAALCAGIDFLEKDFDKNNGYRRSIDLSKEMALYRQKYCGCEFSR
jgi:epoxyqueuosine reductase